MFTKDTGKVQVLRIPKLKARIEALVGKSLFPNSSLLDAVVPFTYWL